MEDRPYVSIFDSTSKLAGEAAARSCGQRRKRILAALAEGNAGAGGKTIWEIADELGVYDHQISGRFSELVADGLIARGTPEERRRNPKTGCLAEVYRLAETPKARAPDLGDRLGYPPVLIMEGDAGAGAGAGGKFERSPILKDDAPGIPYARTGAGIAEVWRVELVECPGCGRTLKMVEELVGGQKRKTFRCGTPSCHKVQHLLIVREPGGPQVLALVMKTL
jgi:hypothetical protein